MKHQIIKGARSFKLDIILIELETCKKFSKNTDFSINEFGFDEILACLAIRGDLSSSPYLFEPFDTTEDLLKFLKSEFLVKILTETNSKLWIELDFKDYDQISLDSNLLFDFLMKLFEIIDFQKII